MIREGFAVAPTPLARAIRYGLLLGAAAGGVLQTGCTDQGERFVSADESSIGDAISGELSSASTVNLKDGSRQGRHWVCADGHGTGVLYRLKAPFLGQVTLFDTAGNWLGGAGSTLESQASVLLSGNKECYLVAVSGRNQADFGPYTLEPVSSPLAERLGDGQSVSGIAEATESAYTFTVEEASQVSLRLSGGASAALALRGEGVTTRPSKCGDDQRVMTTYLEPGEYQAVVIPGGCGKLPEEANCQETFASAGSGYRLSLDISGLSTGERNAGPLRDGDRITGHLAAAGDSNQYTLEVEEPTQVTLRVSSDQFDAMLNVQGGQTNIDIDDTNDDTNPLLDQLLMPGRYRVTVSGYESEHGNYAIDITTAPFDGDFRNSGELAPGESLFGMAEGSASNVYTLKLEQAADVEIHASSSIFDTLLSLEGPGVALTDDDGGGDTNSRIVTLLTPGEYRVEVSSYSGGTGPFRLETLVAPYGGEIRQGCDGNAQELCVIEAGTTVIGELHDSGQPYRLVLEEPARVDISMNSTAFDTLLKLEGDGTNLSDDDGGGDTNSRLSTTLESGTYQITADSYDGNGAYVLRLESIPVQR